VHNSATLECHLCLKRFDQTIHFNRHMKTHYGPNAQFDVPMRALRSKIQR
uniref:C2H2-type domain-containing protein n=1 Tax=Caenorhabditis japonica TaxID=281687 RepID=A0A8R1IL89_CAEJA